MPRRKSPARADNKTTKKKRKPASKTSTTTKQSGKISVKSSSERRTRLSSRKKRSDAGTSTPRLVQTALRSLDEQMDRAKKHLDSANRPANREFEVQRHMAAVFEELGAAVAEASPSSGLSDLYLTNCNTIIETKAASGANPDGAGSKPGETQLEQLTRYVVALIDQYRGELDLAGKASQPWFGILTDGGKGFVYEWDSDQSKMELLDEYSWQIGEKPELVLPRIRRFLHKVKRYAPLPPENLYQALEVHEAAINQAYTSELQTERAHLDTKFQLWLDRLRASGLAPSHPYLQHDLFVKHNFLVAVAKAVTRALSKEDIGPGFNGLDEGFTAWLLDSEQGKSAIHDLFSSAGQFDWSSARRDVLQSLYQDCIDPVDRKMYGEYYTPDWLAGQLAEEILDDAWIESAVTAALNATKTGRQEALHGLGILDPTCGSGTFLFHAALRIRRSDSVQKLDPDIQARVIASLLHGMDVHPVAVEMARASILRALPTVPKDLKLNVSQGDALFTFEGGVVQSDAPRAALLEDELRLPTPRGNSIVVPQQLIEHFQATDFVHTLVDTAVRDRPVPHDITESVGTDLTDFHNTLKEVYEAEGNSVWAWHLHNMIHPLRLQMHKVDRILANPPWVRVSNIQVQARKSQIERQSKDAGLWPGGANATGFDIAGLFIYLCRKLYLSEENGQAVWLANAAAIKGSNWRRFRSWHNNHCTERIDYSKVKQPPFSGANCCALIERNTPKTPAKHGGTSMAKRQCRTKVTAEADEPVTFNMQLREKRQRVQTTMLWRDAAELLEKTVAQPPPPLNPSYYKDSFRQGATVVPQILLLTDQRERPSAPRERATANPRAKWDSEVRFRTVMSPKAKPPWCTLPVQDSSVIKRWLQPLVFSADILPFAVETEVPMCVIPIDGQFELEVHPRDLSEYWRRVDDLYKAHRGLGETTPKSLLANVDYQKKMSTQLATLNDQWEIRKSASPEGIIQQGNAMFGGRCMVLYNMAGTRLRITRTEPVLVDSSCYHFLTPNASEAAYLVAFLNAPCLHHFLVLCQRSDRHFHRHFWEHLPVPRFDPKNPTHEQLASICVAAEQKVSEWMIGKSPRSVSGSAILEIPELRTELNAVDDLVRQALDDSFIQCLDDINSKTDL